jgi:hypothetical protein
MTVNVADDDILDYATRHPAVYTDGVVIQMENHASVLTKEIKICLQESYLSLENLSDALELPSRFCHCQRIQATPRRNWSMRC